MTKLFMFTFASLLVSSAHAASEKSCLFENIGEAMKVSVDGQQGRVQIGTDLDAKCEVTSAGEQLTKLQDLMDKSDMPMGKLTSYLHCYDAASLSNFDILMTETTKAMFAMETEGRILGECK